MSITKKEILEEIQEVRELINDHRFEKRYRIKEGGKKITDLAVKLEHDLNKRRGF